MSTVQLIKLADLDLSPLNVRAGDDATGVDELAQSIKAAGLVTALSVYQDSEQPGRYLVEGGRRRLLALRKLGKKLPHGLGDGVPCIVQPSAELAGVRSLVENSARLNMSHGDELTAFRRLVDAGHSHDQVAAACGVKRAKVAKVLALVNLAPPILAAYCADQLSLETAEAFTVEPDQDRQASTFAALSANGGHGLYPSQVRRALVGETVDSRNSMRARLVGRAAYIAAGGTVVADLFADAEDGEQWRDAALLDQLATKALEAIAFRLTTRGADHAEISLETGYAREFWKARQVEVTPGDDADLAGLHCLVALDYNGDGYRIHYARPREVTTDGTDGRTLADQYKAADKASGALDWGHEGHRVQTLAAQQVVGGALFANPDKAADVLLAHMLWQAFGHGHSAAVTVGPRGASGWEDGVSVVGGGEIKRDREAWQERAPRDFANCLALVVGLDASERAKLQALILATTLDAMEPRFEPGYGKPAAWAQLQAIAEHLDVKPAQAWVPQEPFFALGSKSVLVATLDKLGADPLKGAKKPELVEHAARLLEGREWMPPKYATLRPGAAVEGQGEGEGANDAA